MATRNDDLKDSFYLHIMRNSIGAGLRNKYGPTGPMPDRLAALVHQIDESAPPADAEGGESSRQPPDPPAHHRR